MKKVPVRGFDARERPRNPTLNYRLKEEKINQEGSSDHNHAQRKSSLT